MRRRLFPKWFVFALPLSALLIGAGAFWAWIGLEPKHEAPRRVPTTRAAAKAKRSASASNPGKLIPGTGKPGSHSGSWPQFRGARRDNIAPANAKISRTWPKDGPPVLWRIPVGEGHAGAVIDQGRVYLTDYDREKGEDAIRCLSFDTGAEIWRYTYSIEVKRNHGMSRTVPAVDGQYLVSFGPKCQVVCLKSATGELVWKKDLVEEYGAVVPLWYAGQCPLIDKGLAILAPGGKPLMMAVDLATGTTVWETKELDNWGMTHSSIVPMELLGQRQYVYCAQKGVAGVAAGDGRILWQYPNWRIKIANISCPVQTGKDHIFLSGGYNSGSAMVKAENTGDKISLKEEFRLDAKVFGADQQTPILYQDHIYGVEPKGELACLGLDGTRLWSSGQTNRFGLGSYLIVDGMILILDDEKGTLHLVEATPLKYTELTKAKLLFGPDAWGPMAFADGRLILRDLTEMVCVAIGE